MIMGHSITNYYCFNDILFQFPIAGNIAEILCRFYICILTLILNAVKCGLQYKYTENCN